MFPLQLSTRFIHIGSRQPEIRAHNKAKKLSNLEDNLKEILACIKICLFSPSVSEQMAVRTVPVQQEAAADDSF